MARESLTQVYFNRRMAVLAGLGFASGLPSAYALLGQPLQLWLGTMGYDVKTIGLATLLGLPFSLNFAWAPLLDRYAPPPPFRRLGRRRGWLALVQILLFVAIAALAWAGAQYGRTEVLVFAFAGLVVATLAATQDVLADAYRTEVLPPDELGPGAAVFVNGYRIAMFVATGGAILLAARWGWPAVYGALAGLMLIGLIATLCAPVAGQVEEAPSTLLQALSHPLIEFFRRNREKGVLILAFVILFKLPDSSARAMVAPLLQKQIEFDMKEIAWVQAWLGIIMAMLGAFVGGAVVTKLGVRRSLWPLGLLQMLSNLGFVVLAMYGRSVPMLAVVVAIEGFCGGMVTAGFIAFLMSLCNRRYTATQYALFTSLNYFTGALVGAMTGYLVAGIGYVWFFGITVLAGLPGLGLLATIQNEIREAPASGEA